MGDIVGRKLNELNNSAGNRLSSVPVHHIFKFASYLPSVERDEELLSIVKAQAVS